jgi:DNA-binding GntR family transcriptional regulator
MTVPDYQRVVDSIIARIESGELRPGDQLESIAQLAEVHRTSQTTVKTAQALLRAQGWIIGRQGKAVYVAPRPAA